jgi:2-hydroxychromene-2-carboxylate isomerase
MTTVTLYADPACPFGWTAAGWLRELAKTRTVEVRPRLMSLAMLNEGRAIPAAYRDLLDRTRGPARVAAAVAAAHGPEAHRRFAEGFGDRVFGATDHYAVLRDDLAAVIAAALDDAGLPADHARAAGDERQDAALRASHDEGMAPLGGDGGTPVVHLDGTAFFGPVLTTIPRGDDAARLFDAMCALAAVPHLVQLKRPMPRSPQWTATRAGR